MTEAETFLRTLRSSFAYKYDSRGSTLVRRTWDHWESSGIESPSNIGEIEENLTSVIDGYYGELSKAAEVAGTPPFLFYGQFRNLNAFAQSFADESRVIVVDSFLDTFFIEFITGAMFCAFTNPDDARLEQFRTYFESSLAGFYRREAALTSGQSLIFFEEMVKGDYELAKAGAVCASAIIAFVLAHELSHHLLGHEGAFHFTPGEEETVIVEQVPHAKEFDADRRALELMIGLMENKENWLGGDKRLVPVCLLLFEVLHYANEFVQKNPDTRTHPPPRKRKEALWPIVESLQLSESDLQIHDAIEEVLMCFCEGIEPSEWRALQQSKRGGDSSTS